MQPLPDMKPVLAAFVLGLVLAGCQGLPVLKRIDAGNENAGALNEPVDVHAVDVVSILPETFDHIHLGATRFSNQHRRSDTREWAINDFLEGLITESIRHDQRFEYIDSGLDAQGFRPVLAGMTAMQDSLDMNSISAPLEALYREHGIDTLILIMADRIEDPIEDTVQEFTGYGLYRNASLFKSVYLYSYLRVVVVDTRTRAIRKDIATTDYTKLPKEFWANHLEGLEPRERRYIKSESLKMAGRNTLGALVEARLINQEAVYTTESGTRLRTDRLQEAGNYGELYEDAVERVYLALDLEKHFERYALLMQGRHEEVIEDLAPYRDIYLSWMRNHVSWEILKPKMIDEYRKEFTAEELNEIADFAETEAGAKMLAKIPVILGEQENIWLREAKSKVELLDEAVMRRRSLTEY
ncbi:MAG: DUF2059 domain-containing protein [Gammaproteobacteria bacterium]|nr:DUF2059 domain-containing protein [Gammaproteobacteria bacterium]